MRSLVCFSAALMGLWFVGALGVRAQDTGTPDNSDAIQAIDNNDFGHLKQLLSEHPDWATPELLIEALAEDRDFFVDYLLQRHLPVQATNAKGTDTPLLAAIRFHNLDAVRKLLAAGASPNGVAGTPNPLAYNCLGDTGIDGLFGQDDRYYDNMLAIAKLLIAKGASVNPPGEHLLLDALRHHYAIALLLIAHGANLKQADEDGTTALHLAIHPPTDLETSQDDRFPEPASMKSTPAGPDWQAHLVKVLIAAHAPLNARDSSGATALLVAVESGKCVGDPDHQVSSFAEGDNTLRAQEKQRNALAVIVPLLAAGADPNVADNSGQTPLHAAVSGYFAAAARLLLAHHANPNATDSDGRTPADLARMLQPDLGMPALIAKYGGKL